MTTTSPGAIARALTAAKHASSESKTRAGPRWWSRSWPASLTTQPVRREVAAQDREPAGRLQRLVPRDDDLLAGPLEHAVGDLAQRAPVDAAHASSCTTPAANELARDERDAARLEEVGRDEAAARLDVGDDRRPRRDRVEVVDLERDAGLVRRSRAGAARRSSSRRSPAIAAIAFSNASRVSTCDGRVSSIDELHRELARPRPPPAACPGASAGTSFSPGALTPRKSSAVAIVFAVNWPPHAPAPGHATLSSACTSRVGHRAGGVRADGLEDVLDRDVRAAVPARRDRAAVEHEARHVEPRERHHGRGNRLVAADDADEAVEQVAARDELDRVGDHLARDERRAHARRSPS